MNLRQKCKALKRRVKFLERGLSPSTVSPHFHGLQDVQIKEYKTATPLYPFLTYSDEHIIALKERIKKQLLADISPNVTYTVAHNAITASIFVGKRV